MALLWKYERRYGKPNFQHPNGRICRLVVPFGSIWFRGTSCNAFERDYKTFTRKELTYKPITCLACLTAG